jgi:hypothetical protein
MEKLDKTMQLLHWMIQQQLLIVFWDLPPPAAGILTRCNSDKVWMAGGTTY